MKVGNNEVKDILIGETPIIKVYRGEDVIWERGGLPSDYTRVQYLESTGTQYIETDFKATINSAIDVEYQWVGARNTQLLFAGIAYYGQSGLGRSGFCVYADATYGIGFGNREIGEIYSNNKCNIYMDKTLVNVNGVINQTAVTMYLEPTNFQYHNGLVLFATAWTNKAGSSPAKAKIYYCKLYDNGLLVRDFIPCLDENNRPCMYDLVTRQPFYNQGTGEFLYA